MRLFFATDIHGSEVCFRKFLRAADFYGVEALFLGGDYSSKSLTLCVPSSKGWECSSGSQRIEVRTRGELEQFRAHSRDRGSLVCELEPEQFHAAESSKQIREKLYAAACRESLSRWATLARDRLGDSVPIYQIPGNDEPWFCDELLNEPPFVPVDRRHLRIGDGLSVLGFGASNPTPWHTPREYSEGDIERALRGTVDPVLADFPMILFCHVPPYDSGLDRAPKLRDDLSYRLVMGAPEMGSVGSTAVRQVIESCRPILGLFGHVHEAKGQAVIGQTVCVNPGSDYVHGRLLGCIVTITRGRVTGVQFTEG